MLARLIEAYADSMGVAVEGLGSTTFSDEDRAKGLEPDECYYVANAKLLIGKNKIDLSIDPPPDLTVEIDISPPDVARQPIYAAMGVPEVWRFNGRDLEFLHRLSDAAYRRAATSVAFPALPLELINELLAIGIRQGQSAAVAELRRRIGPA